MLNWSPCNVVMKCMINGVRQDLDEWNSASNQQADHQTHLARFILFTLFIYKCGVISANLFIMYFKHTVFRNLFKILKQKMHETKYQKST